MINHIFEDGSLWAIVGSILYVFQAFKPLIKSHLRNNHEKSLLASADRAVPYVADLVDASPADRENKGIAMIVEFANKRGIPINTMLAKTFFNQALSRFKLNGGHVNKPKQTVHVTPDGVIKEDGTK